MLTTDSQDKQELPTFEEWVLQFKSAQEEQIGSQKIKESKKRKRNEFEENKTEDEKEKDTEEEDKQAPKLPEELEVHKVTAVSKAKG